MVIHTLGFPLPERWASSFSALGVMTGACPSQITYGNCHDWASSFAALGILIVCVGHRNGHMPIADYIWSFTQLGILLLSAGHPHPLRWASQRAHAHRRLHMVILTMGILTPFGLYNIKSDEGAVRERAQDTQALYATKLPKRCAPTCPPQGNPQPKTTKMRSASPACYQNWAPTPFGVRKASLQNAAVPPSS